MSNHRENKLQNLLHIRVVQFYNLAASCFFCDVETKRLHFKSSRPLGAWGTQSFWISGSLSPSLEKSIAEKKKCLLQVSFICAIQ